MDVEQLKSQAREDTCANHVRNDDGCRRAGTEFFGFLLSGQPQKALASIEPEYLTFYDPVVTYIDFVFADILSGDTFPLRGISHCHSFQ